MADGSDTHPRTTHDVARTIDHTLLSPAARQEDVLRLCAEAKEHAFAGVCVAGSWISVVAEALAGTDVKAVAVAGFPLGTGTTAAKGFEAAELSHLGADEIDTVIHLGHAKAGNWRAVGLDLKAIVTAAGGRPVKAILETGLLSNAEIVQAAEVAVAVGVAFVKTSTGFGEGGATVETVRLLRETVAAKAKVKASGGIRTFQDAVAMLDAGANRLGTSSGMAIVSS